MNEPEPFLKFVGLCEETFSLSSAEKTVNVICKWATCGKVSRLYDFLSRNILQLILTFDLFIFHLEDPLKQSQNPLGSRSEISHTINWVRSHLEHDEKVSIPKQEVYEDYV